MQMEPSIKTFSSFMWKRAGLRAGKDDTQIQVVFALKHDKSKRDSFEKLMLDISTPKSSKYGQHLSKKEVTDFLAPSQENLRKVRDYVSGFNPKMVSVSAHQDMIHVTLSVVEAERMLNTELAAFTSRDNRDITIVRATGPYYLPHEIAPMVNVVDNVVRFPSIRKTQLVETSAPAFGDVGADAEFSSCGAKCIAMTTPAVLQKRYGYPTLDSKDVASGNGMSVAEWRVRVRFLHRRGILAPNLRYEASPESTVHYL
jgi:tripeptidyl-peptidase-1